MNIRAIGIAAPKKAARSSYPRKFAVSARPCPARNNYYCLEKPFYAASCNRRAIGPRYPINLKRTFDHGFSQIDTDFERFFGKIQYFPEDESITVNFYLILSAVIRVPPW